MKGTHQVTTTPGNAQAVIFRQDGILLVLTIQVITIVHLAIPGIHPPLIILASVPIVIIQQMVGKIITLTILDLLIVDLAMLVMPQLTTMAISAHNVTPSVGGQVE